jgi:gliding-associated putative ABC transporter substrate-binding component GldG
MYSTKKQALTRTLIIIGILALINILIYSLYIRVDLTDDNRYTLSEATKNVLRELDEPVTITAYFSEDVPPQVKYMKNDFKNLLTEYVSYSNNNIVYNFVNPNKDDETQKAAERKGIQPQLHEASNQKDKYEQRLLYMGVVIQIGDKSETIPAIVPGAPMEYALTFAIRKLSLKDKQIVGMVQGQGEATQNQTKLIRDYLSVLYDIQDVNLNDSIELPENIKTLLIINPTDTFTIGELTRLNSFYDNGGNVFVAYGYVQGDLRSQQPVANVFPIGLEAWLSSIGIEIKNNLVFDENSNFLRIPVNQGNYMQYQIIPFPYIPKFNKFGKHTITFGLEEIVLGFNSEIIVQNPDTNIKYTNLILSSNKSGVENLPVYFNIHNLKPYSPFNRQKIPVAVAIEDKSPEKSVGKMVVVSNGDFALLDNNGQFNGTEDNLNFVANAVDWLADNTGLVNLRTKVISKRPIEQLEEKKIVKLQYLNLLLPVLIIIVIGVVRFQIRKRKRAKWEKA